MSIGAEEVNHACSASHGVVDIISKHVNRNSKTTFDQKCKDLSINEKKSMSDVTFHKLLHKTQIHKIINGALMRQLSITDVYLNYSM